MNWEAIGAIGEIFGGLAVLVTLIYLAQQIKQSTRSQSIATYEAAITGYNDVQCFVAGDIESASIWRRGSVDTSALNEDEAVRFEMMVRNFTNHIYKLLRLYQQGVFPESEWIKSIDEAKQLFQTPGFAEFKQRNNYFADLWSEMDSRILSPISTFSGTSASLSDSP
jgi:hypothetical protein